MTRGRVLGLAAAAVGALSVAVAVAGPKSGPGVGDKAAAFNVRDITGPNAGKTLCYR